MEMKLKKVEGNKLKNRVYNEILRNIITSNFSPGDQLQIKEIAETMNVSNTPVREALEALKNDGILEKLPYKSFSVKKHSLQEAKDVYETSAAIETYTVKLAAERISEEELEQIIALHEEGYKYLNNLNIKEYKNHDEELHYKIVQASRNDNLINMYKNIKLELSLFSSQVLGTAQRIQESYEQHSQILDFLKNNKKKKAGLAMESHIMSAWQEFRKYHEEE